MTLSDGDPTLTMVGRGGRYNVLRLMPEHVDTKLTDLLATLADCPRARSERIHDHCKARHEGL
jgi:hypothetical protein